jgi:hypothetical protein
MQRKRRRGGWRGPGSEDVNALVDVHFLANARGLVELDAIAAAKGTSRSAEIREALSFHVARHGVQAARADREARRSALEADLGERRRVAEAALYPERKDL